MSSYIPISPNCYIGKNSYMPRGGMMRTAVMKKEDLFMPSSNLENLRAALKDLSITKSGSGARKHRYVRF